MVQNKLAASIKIYISLAYSFNLCDRSIFLYTKVTVSFSTKYIKINPTHPIGNRIGNEGLNTITQATNVRNSL